MLGEVVTLTAAETGSSNSRLDKPCSVESVFSPTSADGKVEVGDAVAWLRLSGNGDGTFRSGVNWKEGLQPGGNSKAGMIVGVPISNDAFASMGDVGSWNGEYLTSALVDCMCKDGCGGAGDWCNCRVYCRCCRGIFC